VLKTVPEKATFLQSLHSRDCLRLLGMVDFLCCCSHVSSSYLASHATDSGTMYIETLTALGDHTRHTCLFAPLTDSDLSNCHTEHLE
jgi:hypothetical protein